MHLASNTLVRMALSVSLIAPLQASPDSWEWIVPDPGNALRQAATDGNVVVAVGSYGTVLTKPAQPNNTDWQVSTIPAMSADGPTSVVWTGRQFIAAGGLYEGFAKSPNGKDWSVVTNEAFFINDYSLAHLERIEDGRTNGITVALPLNTLTSPDGDTTYLRSTNGGDTWQQKPMPRTAYTEVGPPGYALVIVHTNPSNPAVKLFVAAGSGSTITTSADGLSWSVADLPLENKDKWKIRQLASNGRILLATADYETAAGEESQSSVLLRSSDDGNTWETVAWSLGPPIGASAVETDYRNELFWTGSDFLIQLYADQWSGYYISSDDGETWKKADQLDIWRGGIRWIGQLNGEALVLHDNGQIGTLTGNSSVSYQTQFAADADIRSAAGLNDLILALNWRGELLRLVDGRFEPAEQPLLPESYSALYPDCIQRIRGINGDRIVTAARSGNMTYLYETTDGNTWDPISELAPTLENYRVVTLAADPTGSSYALLLQNDEDSRQTLHLYRGTTSNGGWEWVEVERATTSPNMIGGIFLSHPPVQSQLQTISAEIQHDGERFIVRDTVGRIWVSEDLLNWDALPPLPDDSLTFLKASSFTKLEWQQFGENLRANYASYFASDGKTLVVRRAKISSSSGDPQNLSDMRLSGHGPDALYTYPLQNRINQPSSVWSRIINDKLFAFSDSYAPMLWTGKNFISPFYHAGLVATSGDGSAWSTSELRARVNDLQWTANQVLCIAGQGGILSHPTGVAKAVTIERNSFEKATNLRFFADLVEQYIYLYDLDFTPDQAVLVRSEDGQPVTWAAWQYLFGEDFAFEDPQVEVSRAGNIVSADVSFNGETRRFTLNVITGIARLESITSPISTPQVTGTKAQRLTFQLPKKIVVGRTYRLNARTNSRLRVEYSVSDPAVAEIVSLRGGARGLKILSEGTATVTASQPGNSTWAPATSMVRSFTAQPAKSKK